jgi:preprotein translocase subunit SecD|tara:strand:- start:814 stop:1362 length:549 start_codon:yes stop_codon:yes gene_type:complete
VIAGAIGLALVLIFMVLYYKVPGVVASITLILYAVVLLALFKLIPVTLTLSGVAALILSVGLAVDANILIAERTKEELRMGRALLASITTGFDRAWPSIRDGNISTIITCVVLFWFGDRLGTSLIQGFALTLAIGVIVSMFTAFFASRVIMRSIAGTAIGRRIDSFVPVGTVGAERAIGAGE